MCLWKWAATRFLCILVLLAGHLFWNPNTRLNECSQLDTCSCLQVCRHSPRHGRRSVRARVQEEKPSLVEVPESESETSLRKRKVKKRVQPEFYQSIQVTPTRKAVGIPHDCIFLSWHKLFILSLENRVITSCTTKLHFVVTRWSISIMHIYFSMPEMLYSFSILTVHTHSDHSVYKESDYIFLEWAFVRRLKRVRWPNDTQDTKPHASKIIIWCLLYYCHIYVCNISLYWL